MSLSQKHDVSGKPPNKELWFSQLSCLRRAPLLRRPLAPAQAAACTSGMVGEELGTAVAGPAHGQMPSGRKEDHPGRAGCHPPLPPSRKTCYAAASSFTVSVRAALCTTFWHKGVPLAHPACQGGEARRGRSAQLQCSVSNREKAQLVQLVAH